jgi:nucleoside-diphosphate-sugar epimerase
MKILITGNLGYVGACLMPYLRWRYPQAFIAGYDIGFFQHSLTAVGGVPERVLDVQFYGDIRTFEARLLKGFDHIIHLAAISNDPMGKKYEKATYDVNFKASVDLAQMASAQGARSFVFASSCSVYGFAGDETRTETSALNPLTAYAKSKVMTEQALAGMATGDMTITNLRFGTACGMSERLRLDLVLNDFVASALTTGKITILSDGTPCRPLIDVKDMVRAIDWAMTREASHGGRYLVCNTGSNQWNYIVKELAAEVQKLLPGVSVSINTAAAPDQRSYKVDFSLFESLAGEYASTTDIDATIKQLIDGLRMIRFNDREFRSSGLMRLNTLTHFIEKGMLDSNLRWQLAGGALA